MRLRVNFGIVDNQEVYWYKPLDLFPKLIKFHGDNYELVFYDTDSTNQVDTILTYSRLAPYDPNFNVTCPIWQEMFPDVLGGCECGARFSSFPWDHMRMCKKWTKW